MEDHYSRAIATIMIVLSVLAMVCLGFISSLLPYAAGDSEYTLSTPLWTSYYGSWFIFYFPPIRILDFFMGCNLGYLFVTSPTNIPGKNDIASSMNIRQQYGTLIELASISLLFVLFIIRTLSYQSISYDQVYVWWDQSLIWIGSSILLVYVFAVGSGSISHMLVNRITMYLARMSQYAFLIHTIVFRYLTAIWWHAFKIDDKTAFSHSYGALINLVIGFPLTILGCEIWIRIQNYYQRHYRHRFNN